MIITSVMARMRQNHKLSRKSPKMQNASGARVCLFWPGLLGGAAAAQLMGKKQYYGERAFLWL